MPKATSIDVNALFNRNGGLAVFEKEYIGFKSVEY
jgi:hypothetical protein